jgi:hypothetical protein
MATKKHFFHFGSFSINDGSQIRFWEDRWLGSSTLREQSPALYTIFDIKGIPFIFYHLQMCCSGSFLLGLMNFDGIYMPMAIS